MGWASASEIVEKLITSAKKHIIDNNKRRRFYIDLISVLEEFDWDTQDECIGLDKSFDLALKKIHPDWDIWDEDKG